MFKKIVVPLDGTQLAKRALSPARALAEQAGVPIELVMSGVDERVAWPHEYLDYTARKANLVDPRLRAGGYRIHDVLAEATAEDESLVCMTTHGRNYIQESFLGRHTARDLIEAIDAPFLVVGPRADVSPDWHAQRLFVCTDGSAAAHAIVPIAADWVQALDLTPVVIEVAPSTIVSTVCVVCGRNIDETEVRSIAGELGDQDGRPAAWEILDGLHAASKIVDYTDTTSNAVVAMATHGRARSVANSVIRFAASPVLVVGTRHHHHGDA